MSSDSSFESDGCAHAQLSTGMPTPNPDFTGNGTFSLETAGGLFEGAISHGQFASVRAATATVPVNLTIKLWIVPGVPVVLPLTGAEIHYTREAGGQIANGQLNGVVKKTDVDTMVVPAIAVGLNAQIKADPSSANTNMLLSLFDTGGAADPSCGPTCKNQNGSCATKGDRVIDSCELGTNGLVMILLQPDVQMFDATGHYHPSAANTDPDSLSFGIAFHAVPAKF